jgi:integrase
VGIADDRKGPLFRTCRGRSGELTENGMLQSDVWRMIRRRAEAAGIKTEIGCHTFRAYAGVGIAGPPELLPI